METGKCYKAGRFFLFRELIYQNNTAFELEKRGRERSHCKKRGQTLWLIYNIYIYNISNIWCWKNLFSLTCNVTSILFIQIWKSYFNQLESNSNSFLCLICHRLIGQAQVCHHNYVLVNFLLLFFTDFISISQDIYILLRFPLVYSVIQDSGSLMSAWLLSPCRQATLLLWCF